MSKEPNKMFL